MEYQLECPFCEQQFTVDGQSSIKKATCPGCTREFKPPAGKRTDALPRPESVQPRASAPAPAALPQAKPLASTADQPAPKESAAEIRTGKPSSLEMAAAKQKRKKQKMIRGSAMILGLATIVGVLSGLLVMRLQQQADLKNAKETVSQSSIPKTGASVEAGDLNEEPEAGSTQSPQSSGVEKLKAKQKQEKQIRHEELPPQDFVFHEPKQVNDCWDLVYPHLVNLTVHDARGKHSVVGTIVDSRGWILTSYRGIKGASKIEITPGYKTIDQFYMPPTLTDSVRGVIMTAPEQDLAVLSINRRFIVSFADLAITEKDFVVEGDFLLQCAPPSTENVYGCYESKIMISGKLNNLSRTSQSIAQAMRLTSAQLPWIVCPDNQKALPGAPLVRINGTLEAIYVFSQDNNAHYVPVHELKDLLANAPDTPQPLSVLQDSSDPSKIAVNVNHPVREASVQMNQLADLCEEFNWIATNKSEYAKLQRFSEAFATAIEYIKKNRKSDPELAKELQSQVKQIKKSISLGLEQPDQPSVKLMNQLAAKDLEKPERVVPFYGLVFELEVSVQNDILKLTETDSNTYVALNPDSSRDRFYRDDVCLAFIKTPASKTVRGFKIQQQQVSAFLVDLITRVEVPK